MGLYEKVLHRFPEALNIPDQTLPGVPIVELYADRRVLIEGRCAILQYEATCIMLRCCLFNICVCGSKLCIIELSGNQLIITGNISQISMRKG